MATSLRQSKRHPGNSAEMRRAKISPILKTLNGLRRICKSDEERLTIEVLVQLVESSSSTALERAELLAEYFRRQSPVVP